MRGGTIDTMSDPQLTHLDEDGRAAMVDVSAKAETQRRAVAEAVVCMRPETVRAIQGGKLAKGDALAVARIAGIQGAKKTADLIPLCHPLRIQDVRVDLTPGADRVVIRTEVRAIDRTGVEMEAMTAASVAGLALYDMIKGVDRSAHVASIRLLEKVGGKSGHWQRDASENE